MSPLSTPPVPMSVSSTAQQQQQQQQRPVLGTTQLPAARIKKIVKGDKQISACSTDALFLISKVTELFIESLMQESFEFSRFDKRKTVQYKDMVKAVQSMEPYNFLMDVIPPTIPIHKAVKEVEQAKGTTSEGGQQDEGRIQE
ncbi:hypothetical protein EV182_000088 [Spiromyces aspiralis]|uniref:Uncharacterized protein n=1 Tax=Spiromyces aspiralis TaxID=68401 RepID=A0ACC1HHJ5_9FUNG|nr:hypothetical protein EV182_000088 [Spiromyces aspiralis]